MSRAPAQIRRPSSSRRGWPTSSARTTGGTAGERGRSNRIPAFTQLTMLRKTALTQPAGQRSAVGTLTLSLAVKDQGVVRDVFEEGWQGCKRGLQVSTTGGPFLTRTLVRRVYLQLPIPVP